MSDMHSSFTFIVPEYPGSENGWRFTLLCGGESRVELTGQQSWLMPWEDMLARLFDGDMLISPAEMAHWLRFQTGGSMSFDVAEKAADSLAVWIASNHHFLHEARQKVAD